jgi:PAS domain S-box-containing protein
MDHGIVGGSLKSQKNQVKAIAELALRVLKGERADTIPPVRRDLNVRQIDWRQLRRWGISEARIPPGTEVLFRQPTVFEQYGSYILGAIGLMGLQTALIAGLVIQKRRRRRAEEALRESEQHFRLTADTAPVMIWRSGTDTGCDFFNKPWLDFRGRTMEEETGNGWTEGVHPSDLANYVNTYVTAFDRREAFRVEYRLRRADGEYRWVLDTGVPRHMHDGTFSGYIGSCIDITERKKAEETLRANEAKLRVTHAQIQDLAGRLITAQEVERSRIAREIHDDVSQQMAVLTMELELLRRAEPSEIRKLTGEVLTRAQGIAKTMHDLSHRLHPARLGLLGLVDSLDALRDELSHYGVPLTFSYDNVPAMIPVDLRLCLYRVVQEGLQNAIKHSHARHISVHLRGSGETLTLSIVDDGMGFDVDASWNKGLGLISMSERLEAIGGSLKIRSANGSGTRLDITVPLTIDSPVVVVEVPL